MVRMLAGDFCVCALVSKNMVKTSVGFKTSYMTLERPKATSGNRSAITLKRHSLSLSVCVFVPVCLCFCVCR